MSNIKIEAYSRRKHENDWVLLPKTSKFLTEKGLIPNVGDTVGLVENDGENVGIASNNGANIQYVEERWFRHPNADVVVILNKERTTIMSNSSTEPPNPDMV